MIKAIRWPVIIVFALVFLGLRPLIPVYSAEVVTHGQGSTSRSSRPLVPRQFPEITEADWTAELPLVGREIECRKGKIRVFSCKNVSLIAFLPESLVGGPTLTTVWGWTDAATGREFVLAAREGGTSFVEITEPLHPRYLGELKFHHMSKPSRWRDVKVYKDHAFIVSDAVSQHGMQVFDLTQLLSVATAPKVFQETAHYGDLSAAHTLAIDTIAGFAYAAGANDGGEVCGGALHMIDIRTPATPIFAGCYVDNFGGNRRSTYVHETQCVTYHGPDRRYRGRQLCFNAAISGLSIVDVTDKQAPKWISVGRYPNFSYGHQGWLTDDQSHLLLGDEGDEGEGRMTRTIVFDLKDLNDPVVVKEFIGTTEATDHNLYIHGRYAYQSNYRAGLRVVDIHDPTNPVEVGYFDTTPAEKNSSEYDGGSWGNYPYFKNGVIAVSSYGIDANGDVTASVGRGLFLLRYRP